MNILFLHQHYYPETVGTSTRLVEIAERLAEKGHRVTVVTGIPSHPSTMASGEVSRRAARHELRKGVHVHRVWSFGTNKPDSFLRRMATYGSFMILGTLKALFLRGKFDVLVAVSPLPNGIGGLVVSALRGLPLMFDVCDIWPDCAIAVGMLQNPFMQGAAFWIEGRIYRRARRIGVVTRGFTENLVAKGVPRQKVCLLPDWVDPGIYDSNKVNRTAVREEFNLDGRFVVSFLGNFGLLMGLDAILETARLMKDSDPDVLFLFVGKGVEQPMMEQRIGEWGLCNVRIIPYQPRHRVPELLAASDALIVTYRKDSITRITVPSKIYEYMSSERPIVAGVEGVIGEILKEGNCGIVSPTRDPQELADAIRRLKADGGFAAALGSAGRGFVMQHFTFERVAADYELAVTETASGA